MTARDMRRGLMLLESSPRATLRFTLLCALLLCVSLVTPLAFGQSSAAADSSSPDVKSSKLAQSSAVAGWLTRSTLMGDWGGLRSTFVERGVSFDLR